MSAMTPVLDAARAYLAAGYCVIPVRPDGTKAPAIASWKHYQKRLPTDDELVQWFTSGRNGIAIICGQVSGGLEVLDFDDEAAYLEWGRMMAARHPDLLATLPQIKTPSGGAHVYCRDGSRTVPGNRKLAKGKTPGKASAETRGEGGYVLAPGSPPTCHPTGGLYVHLSGPQITEAEQNDGSPS